MALLQFMSDDGRYGLQITKDALERMKDHCVAWGVTETGGILVGHYNAERNCAVVTKTSLAPKDSRRGRTWFVRGVYHLQKWLRELWVGRGEYYLGEWHYHPGGSCHPSDTDTRQMEDIAKHKKYACPEPLLIIIAQPRKGTWETGTYVCPRADGLIQLNPVKE